MRKYIIFGLVLIIIIGGIFIPKRFKNKENIVKFKQVDEVDVPEKIMEMLPQYIMEERALTCKYRDDIYVIVTRGEKKSKGFFVDIDKIVREDYEDGKFELTVHSLFIDPKPQEVLPQEYDYPAIIVKTKLKDMPREVHLDIMYVD